MLTAGVDLAAESKRTALAVLDWRASGATLLELHLDVDDMGEVNMEARVVDHDLDEMLERIGLSTDDRQEQDQANVELMHSLLQSAPPQQQPLQQQRRTNTNTANTVNTNTNTTTRYRSQIEDMLL